MMPTTIQFHPQMVLMTVAIWVSNGSLPSGTKLIRALFLLQSCRSHRLWTICLMGTTHSFLYLLWRASTPSLLQMTRIRLLPTCLLLSRSLKCPFLWTQT